MARDDLQYKMALRLLTEAKDGPFYAALKSEFQSEFDVKPGNINPEAIATRYADVAPTTDSVLPLFSVVIRALACVPLRPETLENRRQAERTAAALYFLSACQFVDREVRAANDGHDYVLRLPIDEHMILAIVVVASFGGELHLKPVNQHIQPDYFFSVKPSVGGDLVEQDFERAVYLAVFDGQRVETDRALESGQPLTIEERNRLRERLTAEFRYHRATFRRSVALVVPVLTNAVATQGFASAYRVPIVIPSTDVTSVLVGISSDKLKAEIAVFLRELHALRSSTAQSASPSTQGAAPMSQPPGVHVTVNGNVGNLGVGDHHQQQTGNGSTANMAHREGINFAALTPLLTALMAEIHNLPNGEVKPALVAKVQEIQTEAAKEKPNPSELGTAVEKVKSTVELLGYGEKITDICLKISAYIASCLP